MKTTINALILSMLIILTNSLYCQPDNCYQLLQVSKQISAITHTATTQQIKKAFRAMARRHHPDKNRFEDTTQLFQKINIAYEILENEHTRTAYDYFLRDPSGSRAFHTYQYYRASYSPQVNPVFVLVSLFLLLSWLQWVMRRQMYNSAIESIVNSLQFKKRVNERCEQDGRKGDKIYKQQIAEKLQKQISIQGGYSQPLVQDLLVCRIVLMPYTFSVYVKSWCRWIWKYYIRREQYEESDQKELTRVTLKISKGQWNNLPQQSVKELIKRKLWVRQNYVKYRQEVQQNQLEELRKTNPGKYKKVMNYMKKQQ